MRFSSILALLSGSHVICAPSFLPFVPPIFSSSTAPHSPSSSLCRSSFSNLSTPPGSSLSLARLLALPHLPRGTSSSPSLSFPVLLSRSHVIFGAPRAPTQPPLFSSPPLLFCSPPLYPLPNPPLLNLPLSQYPCFPFFSLPLFNPYSLPLLPSSSSLLHSSPFPSSTFTLLHILPFSRNPLNFRHSSHFSLARPPAATVLALHSSSSSHSIPTSAGS